MAASACGGFFCNSSAPVDQTGEHIIFAVDAEANTTETHVLINYEGPSEEFAWIVPVPSEPEIGLSSAAIFARLQQTLSPRFVPNWQTQGICSWGDDDIGFEADSAGAPTAGGELDEESVTVVASESVGPYDTVTLQATNADVLIDWLQDNDYDLPDDIIPFIEPYVLMGGDVHFVAFKLQSDRDSGDLQPITLTYRGSKPMIPIQLTAVATQPDMGVTAYVLGDYQAVPENYLKVEVNYARVDWINWGSNYNSLVTEAMDEAGGHGFRTEFAGSTDIMDGMFIPAAGYDYDAIAGASLESLTDALMGQGFFGDPMLLDVFRNHIPVPEGVDEQSFYNCMTCYEMDPDFVFDAIAFADELWATIVVPLEHADELFAAHPVVTRMYTTLSAEEMTLDPIFAFNPDLEDFSNVHQADVIVDCGDGGDYYSSPIRIRLEDGREIITGWDVPRDDIDAMPAADSFAAVGESGQPRVIQDNSESINVALAERNAQVAETFFAPQQVDGGGCTSADSRGGLGFGLLGLLGLVVGRRRRRL
ncbi:MAG: MYXO-CTERM domain-containing protein [Bradymonadia bacterium]|jgi:MYXO-CTERM domain-containing protein